MRRLQPTVQETALKTLAPHMEDSTRYSRSKDKGKDSLQVASDRAKREYKREHKAVARELLLSSRPSVVLQKMLKLIMRGNNEIRILLGWKVSKRQ